MYILFPDMQTGFKNFYFLEGSYSVLNRSTVLLKSRLACKEKGLSRLRQPFPSLLLFAIILQLREPFQELCLSNPTRCHTKKQL